MRTAPDCTGGSRESLRFSSRAEREGEGERKTRGGEFEREGEGEDERGRRQLCVRERRESVRELQSDEERGGRRGR